jgi:MoxR-like ATPase
MVPFVTSAPLAAGRFGPQPYSGEMVHRPAFVDVADVSVRLAEVGYLADQATATTVFLADRLGKPLLIEGPAGVGKTELAKAVAAATGAELIRLQCYEGIDEARALYEWNYRKQLLRIQAAAVGEAGNGAPADGTVGNRAAGAGPAGHAAGGARWDALHDDIFSDEFLLSRPLLAAIRRTDPTVLLIDETDKADLEVEALLLEVLSDFQVTVPELGTIHAERRPFVVLTSNASRELSEALKRRCLFLHLDYPDADREERIVLTRAPEVPAHLAEQVVKAVRTLRAAELKKPPSISETLDWARTLIALGVDGLDEATVQATLGVVVKHASDFGRAAGALGIVAR